MPLSSGAGVGGAILFLAGPEVVWQQFCREFLIHTQIQISLLKMAVGNVMSLHHCLLVGSSLRQAVEEAVSFSLPPTLPRSAPGGRVTSVNDDGSVRSSEVTTHGDHILGGVGACDVVGSSPPSRQILTRHCAVSFFLTWHG